MLKNFFPDFVVIKGVAQEIPWGLVLVLTFMFIGLGFIDRFEAWARKQDEAESKNIED